MLRVGDYLYSNQMLILVTPWTYRPSIYLLPIALYHASICTVLCGLQPIYNSAMNAFRQFIQGTKATTERNTQRTVRTPILSMRHDLPFVTCYIACDKKTTLLANNFRHCFKKFREALTYTLACYSTRATACMERGTGF